MCGIMNSEGANILVFGIHCILSNSSLLKMVQLKVALKYLSPGGIWEEWRQT